MNSSPDRGTFQLNNAITRLSTGEVSVENASNMMDFYKSLRQLQLEKEATDEWKQDNMEYDLRNTQWILDKAKASNVYCQNLYAAMCNNEFVKNDVWPLLTDKRWSCSWRHAGGIIADMIEKGDYIDWYCSGIRNHTDIDDERFQQMTKEEQSHWLETKDYVGEREVTDEIRNDLLKLGWLVVDEEEKK